jgi:hypothetical protein
LLGLRRLVARIEEISYLSQSTNRTRWEKLEVGTHMGTLERGGDQEKESASERRKCRSAVANSKRESV